MGQPFNATNKPETCLWCGRRFKPETRYVTHEPTSFCCDAPVERHTEMVYVKWKRAEEERPYTTCISCGERCSHRIKSEDVPTGRRVGYNGSLYFCTLRCGHSYAEAFAALGKRLQPKEDT